MYDAELMMRTWSSRSIEVPDIPAVVRFDAPVLVRRAGMNGAVLVRWVACRCSISGQGIESDRCYCRDDYRCCASTEPAGADGPRCLFHHATYPFFSGKSCAVVHGGSFLRGLPGTNRSGKRVPLCRRHDFRHENLKQSLSLLTFSFQASGHTRNMTRPREPGPGRMAAVSGTERCLS